MAINANVAYIPASVLSEQGRLLRMPHLKSLTGFSRSYLYELIKAGSFPKALKLPAAPGVSVWLESEIRSWITAQVAAAKAVTNG